MSINRPNLFVVGVSKAGTTSLHYYLAQHPEIFMSAQKELNYFSSKEILEQKYYYKTALIVSSIDDYYEHFSNSSGYKVIGESSVSYLFYASAPKRIHDFNPEAKIIIILRDPVERAFSHYLMDYQMGYTSSDFLSIISKTNKEDIQDLLYQQYIPSGEYSEKIDRYLKHFDRDNILFLLYDDLKNSPESLIKKTYEFLDVDNYFQPDFNIVNNYQGYQNNIINTLYRNQKLKQMLKRVLPERIIAKTKNCFRQAEKPLIPAEAKTILRGIYRKDIAYLEQELNMDLANWTT